MPVNIDTVYQKVLAISNKEQRGYITPQEFNLFANQAQLDIFEQYYFDLRTLSKVSGNDTEYSDGLEMINEKLSLFKQRSGNLVYVGGTPGRFLLPDAMYSLGTVIFNAVVEVEPINENELLNLFNAPLAQPTPVRPVYVKMSNGINVYPTQITGFVTCTFTRKPRDSKWAYVVIPTPDGNEKALYDAQNSTDFQIHHSEETKLVYKILELAGLMTREPQLYQSASAELNEKIMQEKQ